MPRSLTSRLAFLPSLSFILLASFMVVLLVAGGSARADVSGQIIVRVAATLVMIVAILFGPRPVFAEIRPVWIIFLACIAVPAIQLIPLPPTMWQALPGRAFFSQAAIVAGEPQPWRPISLSPGATVNAIGSLLIPLATLLLIAQMDESERRLTPALLLLIILASMLIGLMQFAGIRISAPLGDNGPVEVSGFFNNRNHFALLLAMGCVLAPAWAFSTGQQQQWRAPAAFGLIILLILSILASGSRGGMIVGALGVTLGLAIAWSGIKRVFASYGRWVTFSIVASSVATTLAVVLISVAANRAVSVNRILTVDASQDLRNRALPTVINMIDTYFPMGIGYGGFDPLYRVHETIALLSPEYFNHAHNDLLEVVLDGGMFGLILMLSAVLYWVMATRHAWRTARGTKNMLSRVGSAIIFLTIAASIVDYPARTPTIMAFVVVAAFWLATTNRSASSTLPLSGRSL